MLDLLKSQNVITSSLLRIGKCRKVFIGTNIL